MMKKLLVLLMVLGIASLAGATLVMTPYTTANGLVTWSIIGDQLVGTGIVKGAHDGYLGPDADSLVPDTGSDGITDGAWLAGGDICKVIDMDPGLPNGWNTYANSIDPVNQSLGKWFSFGITGDPTTANPLTVTVYNAACAVEGSFIITPEPMTIALLGLGGLFLRRRR